MRTSLGPQPDRFSSEDIFNVMGFGPAVFVVVLGSGSQRSVRELLIFPTHPNDGGVSLAVDELAERLGSVLIYFQLHE